MGLRDAADAAVERELGAFDLPRPRLAAQLLDQLDECEQRAACRMRSGEVAAVGVGGQPTVECDAAVVDEGAAFSLGTEPGVLEFGDHADGEVVGHARDLDVVARDIGETERGVRREATRERR